MSADVVFSSCFYALYSGPVVKKAEKALAF